MSSSSVFGSPYYTHILCALLLPGEGGKLQSIQYCSAVDHNNNPNGKRKDIRVRLYLRFLSGGGKLVVAEEINGSSKFP